MSKYSIYDVLELEQIMTSNSVFITHHFYKGDFVNAEKIFLMANRVHKKLERKKWNKKLFY